MRKKEEGGKKESQKADEREKERESVCVCDV